MSEEEKRVKEGKERRRIVVVRAGDVHDADVNVDDLCCEGAWQSASGEPLHAAIEAALAGREHGVSVRVSEEILAKLDVLVESGICESRSAAATFLIREGVSANAELFNAVESTSSQISELRDALRSRLAALGKEPAGEA
jgi:Arc/MetJ-type ribon-helix-helix transcriptional regulator